MAVLKQLQNRPGTCFKSSSTTSVCIPMVPATNIYRHPLPHGTLGATLKRRAHEDTPDVRLPMSFMDMVVHWPNQIVMTQIIPIYEGIKNLRAAPDQELPVLSSPSLSVVDSPDDETSLLSWLKISSLLLQNSPKNFRRKNEKPEKTLLFFFCISFILLFSFP
ncbi:hypothetical protein VNO77_44646 [Canavalia gladiata]|uniref:Uncharacterized protein n=1 Tax=Canavalia gladiata TaxID=3824 RepID=A0AAN9PQX6_CANGL